MRKEKELKKKIPIYLLIFIAAALLVTGVFRFAKDNYALITLIMAVLSMLPLFLSFEKKKADTKLLAVLAALIAVSVLSRFIFFAVPFFKPVTAMIIIIAMYLGSDAGFAAGAATALISNFYFGQGPWTEFQMFSWGLIGFAAGLLAKRLKKSTALLLVYGALSGVFFSLLSDLWSVLWYDGGFNLKRYIALVTSAAGITLTYAVSNVVFLLIMKNVVGGAIERVKLKYGIGIDS